MEKLRVSHFTTVPTEGSTKAHRIKARLRELEGRQSFIKTEPSNGTASVKRERERSQGNFQDASPAPKRRQTLGEVEIVDLTED